MRRDLFSYPLDPARIAERPTVERDGARLLVVGDEGLEHAAVAELARWLPVGALVVVNDTRVVPARLLGKKVGSGGRAELLLVRKLGTTSVEHAGRVLPAERWSAMGRASKPLRPGTRVVLESRAGTPEAALPVAIPGAPGACPGARPSGPEALLAALVEGKDEGTGLLAVLLYSPRGEPLGEAIEATGHVPLPPYLHRADEPFDRERYQTVFARVPGAVAAPTAGLHLTSRLLERLGERGVRTAALTLHVGLGTFQPVTAEDLDDHPMHAEVFEVPEETAAAVARTRGAGCAVVAVGTTVVRALESAADPARPGLVRALSGETRLLIQPGYRFRVVDRLLTNFHLPESTLLALVCAFAGRERVLDAYRTAAAEGYRFFSYGDAMLLRRAEAA